MLLDVKNLKRDWCASIRLLIAIVISVSILLVKGVGLLSIVFVCVVDFVEKLYVRCR